VSRRPEHAEVLAHFEHDTCKHVMTVLRDNGIDRHLRFRNPDSSYDWFDVMTWQGRLYIGGDCGTFVFDRTADMFQFFRGEPGDINPGYWLEKIEAADKCDGATEFDPEAFRSAMHARRVELVRSLCARGSLNKAERRELWEQFDSEVLDRIDDRSGDVSFYFAYEFRYLKGSILSDDYQHFGLNTDDMPKCERFTNRYLWNCFAIVWAIRQYDMHTAARAAERAGTAKAPA
jgi:hypothetical protein